MGDMVSFIFSNDDVISAGTIKEFLAFLLILTFIDILLDMLRGVK